MNFIPDNRFAIEANYAVKIINLFIGKRLPILKATEYVIYSKFDFDLNFDSQQFKLLIASERGSLGFRLFDNTIFVSLKQYDERLSNVYTCNEENLYFFLEILKEYIERHSSDSNNLSKRQS